MSLIPSESYSFPDHFTTTVVPSRKPKKEEAAPIGTQRKKSTIVPLPNPEPAVRAQKSQPAAPRPNPALRRASAPPPRIAKPPKAVVPPILKPKAQQTRAPALEPAPPAQNRQNPAPSAMPGPALQNVIRMQPLQVAASAPQSPAEVIEYSSAPANATPPSAAMEPQPVRANHPAFPVQQLQPEFFEILAQNSQAAVSKGRKKTKLRRFIMCESIAAAVLLSLAIVGLLHRPSNPTLLWVLSISTIASALIPIFFYAFTPTLPEIEG